jgi:hypothetical protein
VVPRAWAPHHAAAIGVLRQEARDAEVVQLQAVSVQRHVRVGPYLAVGDPEAEVVGEFGDRRSTRRAAAESPARLRSLAQHLRSSWRPAPSRRVPAARQNIAASGTLIRAPDHSCAQLKQYCDGGSESATHNVEAPRHLHRRPLIKVPGLVRLTAAQCQTTSGVRRGQSTILRVRILPSGPE